MVCELGFVMLFDLVSAMPCALGSDSEYVLVSGSEFHLVFVIPCGLEFDSVFEMEWLYQSVTAYGWVSEMESG